MFDLSLRNGTGPNGVGHSTDEESDGRMGDGEIS